MLPSVHVGEILLLIPALEPRGVQSRAQPDAKAAVREDVAAAGRGGGEPARGGAPTVSSPTTGGRHPGGRVPVSGRGCLLPESESGTCPVPSAMDTEEAIANPGARAPWVSQHLLFSRSR